MRAFAITGIVTASWISRILSGSAIRATPPSRRMSAGTRSSAITAQAPASSAITACSASVTSMITPPLSISARPLLTRIVPSSMLGILASGASSLAPDHRRDRSQRDARLLESRLPRRQTLERESWCQQNPCGAVARRLHQLPQLHRQSQREDGHDQRRPERERQWPSAVSGESHGSRERGEVGSATERESRRPRGAFPCRRQLPRLGGCDRPMLRAVKSQRASAKEHCQQPDRQNETCDERGALRQQDESERKDDGEEQADPFEPSRGALPPHQRRERERQPRDPTNQGEATNSGGQLGHPAFDQPPV